jgi:hypothetical protein
MYRNKSTVKAHARVYYKYIAADCPSEFALELPVGLMSLHAAPPFNRYHHMTLLNKSHVRISTVPVDVKEYCGILWYMIIIGEKL